MDIPTIGRRLWYFPGTEDFAEEGSTQMTAIDPAIPFDAGVVYVHTPEVVNLDITDHKGVRHFREAVQLAESDASIPAILGHAEWMPYQRAQSAKVTPPPVTKL